MRWNAELKRQLAELAEINTEKKREALVMNLRRREGHDAPAKLSTVLLTAAKVLQETNANPLLVDDCLIWGEEAKRMEATKPCP